jgi:mannose-6-phosphate isomerase-like protein (cupin superfamily)
MFYPVAGVGLTLYLSAQYRYLRIRDKMRVYYLRWFFGPLSSTTPTVSNNDDDRSTGEWNPSKGHPIISSSSVFSAANGGHRVELSAPGASLTTLTSTESWIPSAVNISQIVLPPGFQTLHTLSNRAEFYYIVKGYGCFTSTTSDETAAKVTNVSSGDVVLVNPLNIRSFSNKGRENLVYLRVIEGLADGQANNLDITKIMKGEKNASVLDSMVEKVIDIGTRWSCRVDEASVN